MKEFLESLRGLLGAAAFGTVAGIVVMVTTYSTVNLGLCIIEPRPTSMRGLTCYVETPTGLVVPILDGLVGEK